MKRFASRSSNFKINVVKSGLSKVIKDEEVVVKIKKDAVEMSRLSYEYSLLIYFDLYEKLADNVEIKKIDFLNYMYCLTNETHSINERYKNLRNNLNINHVYNKSYRGNLFHQLANQYETCFNNNIWMHGSKRIQRFLKCLNPDATKREVEKNVAFLYVEDTTYTKTLNFHFDWEKGHFKNIKSNPISYLKDFYNIQQQNEKSKWKNFKLIPLYKPFRKHIEYGKVAFHQLLCSIKKCPKKMSAQQNQVQIHYNELQWEQHLNIPKNKKFHGAFTTDGVSISMRYDKELPKTNKKPTPDNTDFDAYVGMDPGFKVFIAAVKTNSIECENYANMIVKNKTFQYDNGFYSRKNKLSKFCRKIDETIERDRLQQPNPVERNNPSNYKEYISFCLKWMAVKTDAYMLDKVARLNLDKHIRNSKTVCNYITQLVGNSKKVAVFYGATKVASNCPIKGYIRVPGRMLKQQLINNGRVKVFEVNEFNTTQLCSITNCNNKMFVSKTPARFSFCPKCKMCWNRDTNAANNILKLGIDQYIKNVSRNIKFTNKKQQW
jgi:transposase